MAEKDESIPHSFGGSRYYQWAIATLCRVYNRFTNAKVYYCDKKLSFGDEYFLFKCHRTNQGIVNTDCRKWLSLFGHQIRFFRQKLVWLQEFSVGQFRIWRRTKLECFVKRIFGHFTISLKFVISHCTNCSGIRTHDFLQSCDLIL